MAYPCDYGVCPYHAEHSRTCEINCGLGTPKEPEYCPVCGAPEYACNRECEEV